MRCFLLLLSLVAWLAISGCGPKEPVVAEPTEEEQAAAEREARFGPAAKAPDIQWRSSGLGIRMITVGTGPSPQLTDTVRVHYAGRLKSGQVFDDSRARGQPADFVVNQLIGGWASAMPALKVGGRAEIFIPPHLGYGGLQAGKIPPHSGLIFDVELLAINPPKP